VSNPTITFPRPREVELEQRERPDPPAGSLLVRSRATLVSPGTEVTILSGDFSPGSAWAAYGVFPFDPGYSNVGVVEDVGEGLDASWLGQRVASYGPHARYAVIPPAIARRIPDGIADDQATLFALAETVMNGLRRARIAWGEDVVIFGAGVLGQLAARFCLLAGAAHTIVVDMAASRLELLPDDASIVRVNAMRVQPREVVERVTAGRLADVVIELTGAPDVIPGEFAVLRSQGRFLMLSSPRGEGTMFNFHDLCNATSVEIIGAHADSSPPVATPGNPWTRARHSELYFDLVASGRLDIAPVITRRVPYGEGPAVYRSFLEGSSSDLGVVLDWSANDT
jgi:threonine dehydrogenase-like Zn-dependent dehydrogenase